MRLFLVILSTLTLTPAATAGLYNFAERDSYPLNLRDMDKFRMTLDILKSISMEQVPFDNPIRERYILMAEGATRTVPARWSALERLSFSEYLIRRRKFREATEILSPIAEQNPGLFLLNANLGTAYHLYPSQDKNREAQEKRVNLTNSVRHLKLALNHWPKGWTGLDENQRKFLDVFGWNEGLFDFYRKAETFYLKLVQHRLQEAKQPVKEEKDLTPDALFGDVRFVGESGSFEPGKLAAAERAKLLKHVATIDEGIDMLQQLLLWLPDDQRLCWLLGELYNAKGDIANTKIAFDIVARWSPPFRAREFRERLDTFNDYLKKNPPPPLDPGDIPNKGDKDSKPPVEKPPFDLQTLGIGFAAGAVVMLFVFWQIREIRRRRQHRPAGPAAPVGHSSTVPQGPPPV